MNTIGSAETTRWTEIRPRHLIPLGRFRDISIRQKVIIVTLLASCLALGLTMLVLLAYEAATFRDNMRSTLSADADLIAVATAPSLVFDDPHTADDMLAKLKANREIAAACIYNNNGQIFATYTRPGKRRFPFPKAEPDGYRFENNSLLMFRSISSLQDREGTLFLCNEMASPYAALPSYAGMALGLGGLMLGAAVFFAAIFQRLITVPLLRLAESARQVQEKNDYSVRVPIESSDETGRLADTFNEMLATIESRNRALQHELAERRRVETELQRSRDQLAGYANELERRVDERTAKLRENINFLEGFCYSIAHDLRAPLRSMSGFANALAEDYGTQLDKTGHQYAGRIMEASQRMDKLITDLLVFGRLSQLDLSFANIDLNSQLSKVVDGLQDQIRAARATVTIALDLPSVWANSTVLEQVFANLVANALKFTAKGTLPKISIGAAEAGEQVRVFVKDNGIGIPSEHHQRIFRVFERLHTEREYAGTGIGLAIVKKGIERMKGRVWVESPPSGGTIFWLELQAAGTAHPVTPADQHTFTLKSDFILPREVALGVPSDRLRPGE